MAVPTRNDRNELSPQRPPPENRDPFQASLGRLFETLGMPPMFFEDAFTPPADLHETEDAYVLEIELPGVDKKDIDVSMGARRLIISGERKEKEREGIIRRRSRTVGRFHYEIILPGDVDENGVEAAMAEGVLTVTVPKASTSKARHVDVR
jgi:HSP20 family protein